MKRTRVQMDSRTTQSLTHLVQTLEHLAEVMATEIAGPDDPGICPRGEAEQTGYYEAQAAYYRALADYERARTPRSCPWSFPRRSDDDALLVGLFADQGADLDAGDLPPD